MTGRPAPSASPDRAAGPVSQGRPLVTVRASTRICGPLRALPRPEPLRRALQPTLVARKPRPAPCPRALWPHRPPRRSSTGPGSLGAGPSGSGQPCVAAPRWRGPPRSRSTLLGEITGAFDHWPVIIACAIAVGIGVSLATAHYETAGQVHGAPLEHVPELTSSGEAGVGSNSRPPRCARLRRLRRDPSTKHLRRGAHISGSSRPSPPQPGGSLCAAVGIRHQSEDQARRESEFHSWIILKSVAPRLIQES